MLERFLLMDLCSNILILYSASCSPVSYTTVCKITIDETNTGNFEAVAGRPGVGSSLLLQVRMVSHQSFHFRLPRNESKEAQSHLNLIRSKIKECDSQISKILKG